MVLLSKDQLENIKDWKSSDIYIIGNLFDKVDGLLNYIPIYLTNILIFTKFLFAFRILQLVENYYKPYLIPLIILSYFTIIAIDIISYKHLRIKNYTQSGELFNQIIDQIIIFIIIRITSIITHVYQSDLLPIYVFIGIIVSLYKYYGLSEILCLAIVITISNFIIEWKYIFESNIIYYSCYAIPFLIILYLSFFFLPNLDYEADRTFKNIPYIIYILAFINSLNFIVTYNYLTVVSLFVIINTELIIDKMADIEFRGIIIYLCIASLLHNYIALIIAILYCSAVYLQIKIYLY